MQFVLPQKCALVLKAGVFKFSVFFRRIHLFLCYLKRWYSESGEKCARWQDVNLKNVLWLFGLLKKIELAYGSSTYSIIIHESRKCFFFIPSKGPMLTMDYVLLYDFSVSKGCPFSSYRRIRRIWKDILPVCKISLDMN